MVKELHTSVYEIMSVEPEDPKNHSCHQVSFLLRYKLYKSRSLSCSPQYPKCLAQCLGYSYCSINSKWSNQLNSSLNVCQVEEGLDVFFFPKKEVSSNGVDRF